MWDVTKSSSILTLFLNSLFSAWHSFISFSNVHRRQVSEMNLNCCGANLPWQLVHFLNDEGIFGLDFLFDSVVANSNLSRNIRVLIVMRLIYTLS